MDDKIKVISRIKPAQETAPATLPPVLPTAPPGGLWRYLPVTAYDRLWSIIDRIEPIRIGARRLTLYDGEMGVDYDFCLDIELDPDSAVIDFTYLDAPEGYKWPPRPAGMSAYDYIKALAKLPEVEMRRRVHTLAMFAEYVGSFDYGYRSKIVFHEYATVESKQQKE